MDTFSGRFSLQGFIRFSRHQGVSPGASVFSPP